jgi:ABC-2 type transport system permease protein
MVEAARPHERAAPRLGAPLPHRWRAELSAVAVIAHRDFVKLLRDRLRLLSELAFPLVFVLLMGPALQAGFGAPGGLNLTAFVFTGVLAQTIWQSAVLGLVSLVADREEDFSQEIFVSPVSRFSIVTGKIIGESLVALPIGVGTIVVGLLVGVPMSPTVLVALVPVSLLVAFNGGAFGLLLLSRVSSQRTANQVFPFLLLPQYFLAGVFNPIHSLPLPLAILSALSPLRYGVELTRNVVYGLQPAVPAPQMDPPLLAAAVLGASFLIFLVAGTFLFVRAERNR